MCGLWKAWPVGAANSVLGLECGRTACGVDLFPAVPPGPASLDSVLTGKGLGGLSTRSGNPGTGPPTPSRVRRPCYSPSTESLGFLIRKMGTHPT